MFIHNKVLENQDRNAYIVHHNFIPELQRKDWYETRVLGVKEIVGSLLKTIVPTAMGKMYIQNVNLHIECIAM